MVPVQQETFPGFLAIIPLGVEVFPGIHSAVLLYQGVIPHFQETNPPAKTGTVKNLNKNLGHREKVGTGGESATWSHCLSTRVEYKTLQLPVPGKKECGRMNLR